MMKYLLLIITSILSFSTYAVENCTFGQKDMIIINWSGGCKNQSVSGVGEMLVNDVGYSNGQQIKRKFYGLFLQGARIGVSMDLPYAVNDVVSTYQTGWFRFDDPNGNPSLIPVVFKISDPNPNKVHDYSKINWHRVVNDKPDYSQTITFDQAFDEITRYAKAQNTDSIDLKILKSYLQGKEKSNLMDDPPVPGIKLSLSGKDNSSVKTKKKSKKKN